MEWNKEKRDTKRKSMGNQSEENQSIGNQIRIELPALSENEEYARVAAAVFASRLDPTLEEIGDIKTAVSEAVTNSIIHGYAGRTGIIVLLLWAEERTFFVEIQDFGCGISDIKKAMEPMYTTDLAGERSGMGFSFMEAFMDSVAVRSEPGVGTIVQMKKRIGG